MKQIITGLEALKNLADGAEKLANYLEDDTLSDLETIIDPEAETEEDLQPSYIGMAILQCEVCKSNIYKANKCLNA